MPDSAEFVAIHYEGWAENGFDYGHIRAVYGPFPTREAVMAFITERHLSPADWEQLTPARNDGTDHA